MNTTQTKWPNCLRKEIQVSDILQEADVKLMQFSTTTKGTCIQITGVKDDLGLPHMIHLTVEESTALGKALIEWADAQG